MANDFGIEPRIKSKYYKFCKNELNGTPYAAFVRQACAAYYASEKLRIEHQKNTLKNQFHGECGC